MTAGKNKALLIGIDQYDRFHALPYAKRDAMEVYRVLTDPDIGVFSKEDVDLLTPENSRVTKSEVEQKLEKIFMEANGEDTVLVYFAGHGKLDKNKRLFLTAQDTTADRLVSTSISMETIRNIIENSDCRRAVFIIDSCYSGAMGFSWRSPEQVAESLRIMPEKGTIIISASQAFQGAIETENNKHGVFTDFFIRGLTSDEIEPDEEGHISLDDIYKYVKKNVEKQTNGKQEPSKTGEIDGEIYIAKSAKFIKQRNTDIDDLLISAQQSLSKEKQEEVFDAYLKVLKLEPTNHKALEEMTTLISADLKSSEKSLSGERLEKAFDAFNKVLKLDKTNQKSFEGITFLIEHTKEKLTKYQLNLDEKIETAIYSKAHEMLEKSYISLKEIKKQYVRLTVSLVIGGLSLDTFKKDWREIEAIERQQETDELDRKARSADQRHEPVTNIPPGPQTPTPAKLEKAEPKPETPKQSLSADRATKIAQVFVSYAHEDMSFLDDLKTMLDPLITDKTINFWDDSKIEKGDKWLAEIEKQLKNADIFVVLVSDEFLKSKFVKEKEMPSMIESVEKRGVIFLWLLVTPCRWDKVEVLKSRQAAHLIKGQLKPLDSFSGSKKKMVLVEITRVIEDAAQRIVTMRANPNIQ